MEQLFLNNRLVDLGNQKIVRNIRASDIGDITKLKSSFSYTINVPRSSKNLVVLDMLSSFANTSRKPFELIKCRYVIDGITLISEGQAIIRESRDSFKINIIDGVANLSSLLGNKKLSELDLSELIHDVTKDNIVDSFDLTTGYVYAIADFGDSAPVNTIDLEYSPPGITVRYIFEKIFQEIEIEIENIEVLTDDTSFLSEILPPVVGYELIPISEQQEQDAIVDYNYVSDYRTSTSSIYTLVYLTVLSWIANFSRIESGAIDELLIQVDGVYTFELNLDYSLDDDTELFLQVSKNGGLPFYDEEMVYGQNLNFTGQFVENCVAGDRFTFRLAIYSSRVVSPYIISYGADLYLNTTKQQAVQLLDPSKYIGEMTQAELIKDISNRYGLILQPSKIKSNTFSIHKISDILKDFENSEDWSNKIASEFKETYANSYAQSNLLKYNYNSELTENEYNGKLEIENENSKVESTLYQSPVTIQRSANIGIEEGLYLKLFDILQGNVTLTNEAFTIAKYKQYTSPINLITFKLFNEYIGVTNQSMPFYSYDNCSMQYYIDNYYSEFEKLLNDYRKLTVNMNLSVVDIYNLDFSKLVFLRQTGRYYYVNSVRYSNNNQSKVELIEVK